MKTLDEWNKERAADLRAARTYPKPNGLACPECGAELQDTDGSRLMSSPPQVRVNCSKCGFFGYRIA
jgi:predicted RNA-binding Zn-ribbon protein involved in translation (DUF1610 family)